MMDRPIIFDAESVRAILAGHKWQTRRVIRLARDDTGAWADAMYPAADGNPVFWWGVVQNTFTVEITKHTYATGMRCPYGAAGDRLWVREAWALVPATAYRASPAQQTICPTDSHDAAIYKAGWSLSAPTRWRSPIHMPRWASRLLLTITDVRVERLQDISEHDARAEGCTAYIWTQHGIDGASEPAVTSYAARWDSINGKRAPWASDPWVWVISFEVVR